NLEGTEALPKSSVVCLTGNGYSFATDVDKTLYGIRHVPGDVTIHVTHGMLLASSPPSPDMRWTSLEEVASLPNAPDVLINGHDHIGFGVRRVGQTLFINPGALCRLSADVREIDRTVQVALLEVPDTGAPTAELSPLQAVRSGKE